MKYEEEPVHDWIPGAASYSEADLDKLEKQEPIDPVEEGKISVHMPEIFGEEPDE